MPILVPSALPALETLRQERVPIMTDKRAARQDIRPLRVVILNLMPDKIRAETQLLRVLGASPLQIDVTLLHPATHKSKNTSAEHLSRFYQTHADIKDQCFDAMIMTGAPVEQMPFEDVNYWPEITEILDWASTHVYSSMFICWGAQAAIYHYHGVPKYELPSKRFGVYTHRTLDPYTTLTAGFDDQFGVPVSRHTEVRRADVEGREELEILVESDESGLCLLYNPHKRHVYMFNHLEYDARNLQDEYIRDCASDPDFPLPKNYFPDDDPDNTPHISWRAHRNLLFSNWINMVYQGTPYNLEDLLS